MFYLIQQLISNKKAFLTILFLSFIKYRNLTIISNALQINFGTKV
jgi:hypothetical protein